MHLPVNRSSALSGPPIAFEHETANWITGIGYGKARDSLGEVTKLPAAQQLSGELRTQLTQLIANFNELITTNTE